MSEELIFFVNGQKFIENNPDPGKNLATYLRESLYQTGTKVACGEGRCGSCTVMISQYQPHNKSIIHFAANACLMSICSLHGMAVTTVEGIGSTRAKLHPVQERLVAYYGTQCGFCTPGMVMAMYALLRMFPTPTREQIDAAMDGNLCRCTGYRSIVSAFDTFSQEYQCGMGDACCKNSKCDTENINGNVDGSKSLEPDTKFERYEQSQDIIFPSELQLINFNEKTLMFSGLNIKWFRPTSLSDLFRIKGDNKNAKLLAGSTGLVATRVSLLETEDVNLVVISCSHLHELKDIHQAEHGLWVGAGVTINQLLQYYSTLSEKHQDGLKILMDHLNTFANHSIRNMATVGGNIMFGNSTSELIQYLTIMDASLCIMTTGQKEKIINFDERTAIQEEYLLHSVFIPYVRENEHIHIYRQRLARRNSPTTVMASIKAEIKPGTNITRNMKIIFGTDVLRQPPDICDASKERKWNQTLLDDTLQHLRCFLTSSSIEDYEKALILSFFFKFYVSIKTLIETNLHKVTEDKLLLNQKSARFSLQSANTKAQQTYIEVASSQDEEDPIGRPIAHVSGKQQATGEAVFCDDIPDSKNQLFLALVQSSRAHAKILSVDASFAITMPGVVTYVDHRDIPGEKKFMGSYVDVFAIDKVHCYGQVIGGIVADTKERAMRASRMVKVTYEDLKPVLTIKNFLEDNPGMEPVVIMGNKTDEEECLRAADGVIEGELHIAAAKHMYMETHTSLVIPKGEEGEMEIVVASQDHKTAQCDIAACLDVPLNKIHVKIKRVGGGFGGKSIQSSVLLVPVAVAANKVGRPVRCTLGRQEDCTIMGTGVPVLARYKVGYSHQGNITAVHLNIYINSGNGEKSILANAGFEKMFSAIEDIYDIKTLKIAGYMCFTNVPTTNALRGFAKRQGHFIIETIIQDVANTLKLSPYKIRDINLKQDGILNTCWHKTLETIDYSKKESQIEEYNRKNRWTKRGISVLPLKYKMGFPSAMHCFSQGAALVHIFTDGSVLVTSGGIEMGQGLHTKLKQIASKTLEIPMSRISVDEVNTRTVPNTSLTAASTGTDIYGEAVKDACEKLKRRLVIYKEKQPDASWNSWVKAAYSDRISLSSTGFYKAEGHYATYGAGFSEVEIDCLTGDHKVLHSELFMELGTSLNPAVDIGQIEGGFINGLGFCTIEENSYNADGVPLTVDMSSYTVHRRADIPQQFNVHIIKSENGDSPKNGVYSSKSIGEPSVLLAASVFFAIKNAIHAARAEMGEAGCFRLDVPATQRDIRLNCLDHLFPKDWNTNRTRP